jgi:hypothetical protein
MKNVIAFLTATWIANIVLAAALAMRAGDVAITGSTGDQLVHIANS